MKKIISAFLACAVMALSLAGCAGSRAFRARGRLCFQRRRQHRRDGNNRILVDGPAKHGVQSSEILFGTQGLAAL